MLSLLDDIITYMYTLDIIHIYYFQENPLMVSEVCSILRLRVNKDTQEADDFEVPNEVSLAKH